MGAGASGPAEPRNRAVGHGGCEVDRSGAPRERRVAVAQALPSSAARLDPAFAADVRPRGRGPRASRSLRALGRSDGCDARASRSGDRTARTDGPCGAGDAGGVRGAGGGRIAGLLAARRLHDDGRRSRALARQRGLANGPVLSGRPATHGHPDGAWQAGGGQVQLRCGEPQALGRHAGCADAAGLLGLADPRGDRRGDRGAVPRPPRHARPRCDPRFAGRDRADLAVGEARMPSELRAI